MADVKAELSKDGKSLIITMPFDKKGSISKSGKSRVHASTNGNKDSDLEVDGKPLTIGLNAYTPLKSE